MLSLEQKINETLPIRSAQELYVIMFGETVSNNFGNRHTSVLTQGLETSERRKKFIESLESEEQEIATAIYKNYMRKERLFESMSLITEARHNPDIKFIELIFVAVRQNRDSETINAKITQASVGLNSKQKNLLLAMITEEQRIFA